jgi:hypothetical protein
MTKQPKERKTNAQAQTGPVQPESPLYRALKIIAQEVAKGLESNVPSKGKRAVNAPHKT